MNWIDQPVHVKSPSSSAVQIALTMTRLKMQRADILNRSFVPVSTAITIAMLGLLWFSIADHHLWRKPRVETAAAWNVTIKAADAAGATVTPTYVPGRQVIF